MNIETIAQNLRDISQEFLDGDIQKDVYRPMCCALIFTMLGFTPKQTERIINSMKMEFLLDKLESINLEEDISNEKQKEEDGKS